MKRLRVCLTLTMALLLVTVSIASADRNESARVLPPHARVEGLTSPEWAAIEFQALFSIPAPENPGLGAPWTDCYLERIGRVGLGVAFFLQSGTFTCRCRPEWRCISPS